MVVVQLQVGDKLVPHRLPENWSTRQAATAIASLVGAPQGVAWWHADWRLCYNPDAPSAFITPELPHKLADPDVCLSTMNGYVVVLAWMGTPETWN